MKKVSKFLSLILGLTVAVGMYSCSPDDPDPVVTVNKPTLSLEPAAATVDSIQVTSNNPWTATASANWITVTPATGQAGDNQRVTIAVTRNAGTAAREGAVTFAIAGVAQVATVTVRQAGELVVLEGNITANRTLTANRKYLIRSTVRVQPGATLTIEPGTVIFGERQTNGTLVVTRGARINAAGTAQRPIVFTSAQPRGQRNYGDWGGIVMLGAAPTNRPITQAVEGLPDAYGGTNADDNSGTMRYVRIEFSGIAISPNNEINGLTMGGVGRGTTIEYIQVSFNGDDAFEWFGGNVNARYLVSHRTWDDDFDTDFGYSGNVQFGVVLRDPAIADQSQSNGFEADNDGQGTAAAPLSASVFSNISVFGPLGRGAATVNGQFGRGAHIRRNSAMSIFNSVITGFPIAGISIDNQGGGTNVFGHLSTGTSALRNIFLAGNSTPLVAANGAVIADVTTYFNDASRNNRILAEISALSLNAQNFNMTAPNFVPSAGSPLLTGAAFTDAKVAVPFFQRVAFVGAFGPDANWLQGWTNFDPQNTEY